MEILGFFFVIISGIFCLVAALGGYFVIRDELSVDVTRDIVTTAILAIGGVSMLMFAYNHYPF